VDPLCSLIMVFIIVIQTIPLIRDTCLILMETVPTVYPIPYTLRPTPYALRPIPDVSFSWKRCSHLNICPKPPYSVSTLYSIPYTLYPISYTLYPIPYALYPMSDALCPIPYPLSPIPYPLSPMSNTLSFVRLRFCTLHVFVPKGNGFQTRYTTPHNLSSYTLHPTPSLNSTPCSCTLGCRVPPKTLNPNLSDRPSKSLTALITPHNPFSSPLSSTLDQPPTNPCSPP
jgi:hypothetical protein